MSPTMHREEIYMPSVPVTLRGVRTVRIQARAIASTLTGAVCATRKPLRSLLAQTSAPRDVPERSDTTFGGEAVHADRAPGWDIPRVEIRGCACRGNCARYALRASRQYVVRRQTPTIATVDRADTPPYLANVEQNCLLQYVVPAALLGRVFLVFPPRINLPFRVTPTCAAYFGSSECARSEDNNVLTTESSESEKTEPGNSSLARGRKVLLATTVPSDRPRDDIDAVAVCVEYTPCYMTIEKLVSNS